jgi:hypothetical protein
MNNYTVPKGYRLVPIVVFENKDYYWEKFEKLLPDLVENYTMEGLVEAIEIEIEIQRERELDEQELAEGQPDEDYGVPRGS